MIRNWRNEKEILTPKLKVGKCHLSYNHIEKIDRKGGLTSNHRYTISSPDRLTVKASFTIPNFFSSNCHFHSPEIKILTMYNRVKVIKRCN